METNNASSELPVLLLGSLSSIRSTTRFQKLAFLADMEVFKNEQMYDWFPHHYGPYSSSLSNDIEIYEHKNLIECNVLQHQISSEPVKFYSLTKNGHDLFDGTLRKQYENYIPEILDHTLHYQFHNTNTRLLQYVYEKYGDFTTKSKILNQVRSK